jgi:hypothetical protein
LILIDTLFSLDGERKKEGKKKKKILLWWRRVSQVLDSPFLDVHWVTAVGCN